MSKVLVAYFSASGVTRKVAAEIAKAEQAERFLKLIWQYGHLSLVYKSHSLVINYV